MNFDNVIEEIAEYVNQDNVFDDSTMTISNLILKDSMGCMVKSLSNKQCQQMMGPIEEDNFPEGGIPVPGSQKTLNLLDASWNIGLLVRWLDYNDCFLAAEWGHPSDNLGGILAAAYHVSAKGPKITVKDTLELMVKAHEIQGVLSLSNSLNKQGYDHVFFVKLATAAVSAKLLGMDTVGIKHTISNVFVDGLPLRIYRQSPNVTARKSWAAGDATRRGVQLSLLTKKMNEGYPDVLSEQDWGFNKNMMHGNDIDLERDLSDYVVNNILFKADFPAEFHAQTGAEAAMELNKKYKERFGDIESINIETHESALRIIANKKQLTNPSDRDHSLEYIIAVALLNGDLKTEYYYDEYHQKYPEIDNLISKMNVKENLQYSRDYLDEEKRSVSNAVQLEFNDKSTTEWLEIEYPIGHKFRRDEVKPVIDRKFKNNLNSYYHNQKAEELSTLFEDPNTLFNMEICDFLNRWNIQKD